MKIYNYRIKEKFLAEKKNKRNYERIFEITYVLEMKYNKDVHDFSLIELEEVIYSFQSNNVNTIRSYKSFLSAYLEWCRENKYISVNNLRKIKNGSFDKYLFKQQHYYLREDFKKWQSGLDSKDDYLISELIFLGVEDEELVNIKVKDFKNTSNSIFLCKFEQTGSFRELKLSDNIGEIIKDIIKDKHLSETDYLIDNPKMTKIGNDPLLTKKNIRDSGLIQCALNEIEGDVVTKVDLNVIYARFPALARSYIRELVNTERINSFRLPQLQKNSRDREYNFYSDDLKSQVLYEHLVNGKVHRWLDINILSLKDGKTNGRCSANILYYLGFKADFRGKFHNKNIREIILKFEASSDDYSKAIKLLKFLEDKELQKKVLLDLESEEVKEGYLVEGEVKYRYIKSYERNPKNRVLAIKEHGVICRVCKFDFEEVYGEHGKDYIEIHHIQQLSELKEATEINPKTDLVPLCSNCHKMIHRKKDNVLTINELIEMVNKKRQEK